MSQIGPVLARTEIVSVNFKTVGHARIAAPRMTMKENEQRSYKLICPVPDDPL